MSTDHNIGESQKEAPLTLEAFAAIAEKMKANSPVMSEEFQMAIVVIELTASMLRNRKESALNWPADVEFKRTPVEWECGPT